MKQIRIEKRVAERTPELKRYFEDIKGLPLLTLEQEIELAIAAQSGNQEAKDMLIKCNLRFVVSVAKDYFSRCNCGSLTLTDLINEGNIGLMDAVGTFDVTKGFKFICYAVSHIRKRIIQAITLNSRVVKTRNVSAPIDYTSLDAPAYDEDNDTTNADIYCQHTDKETDASLLTDILRIMHTILKENERYIVCNILGIQTDQVSRFIVAERLGMTEERVRQIYELSLAKIRSNEKAQILLIKYMAG